MYKLHTQDQVIGHVFCIDPGDCIFLKCKVYELLDCEDECVLIRFNSGGAKWYQEARFYLLNEEDWSSLIRDHPEFNNNYYKTIIKNFHIV